ncbi:MAG: IS66 family insertion sequence element accessory protein TnpA, partial [Nannocystaceae bacterium]
MASRRRSKSERREWARKFRASGLSGAEFARRHELEAESVYRWSREFADERRQVEPVRFDEVRLRPQEAGLAKGEVELWLGKGRRLRVGPDT